MLEAGSWDGPTAAPASAGLACRKEPFGFARDFMETGISLTPEVLHGSATFWPSSRLKEC